MKLTKEKLKQIIKEEIKNIGDVSEIEKLATSAAKQQATVSARGLGKGGITDSERGLINTLQQQLLSAAELGDVGSGKIFRLASMLSGELKKLLDKGGKPEPQAREPQERGGFEREPRPGPEVPSTDQPRRRDPQARKVRGPELAATTRR